MIKFYCNWHQYCNQFRLFVQSWNITVDIDSFQIHNMIYILLIQIMPFLLESNKIGFFFIKTLPYSKTQNQKLSLFQQFSKCYQSSHCPSEHFPFLTLHSHKHISFAPHLHCPAVHVSVAPEQSPLVVHPIVIRKCMKLL